MKLMNTFPMLAAVVLASAACARAPDVDVGSSPSVSTDASVVTEGRGPDVVQTTAGGADKSELLPTILVHKSPTCGCCGTWVDHMREAGFQVEVRNDENLNPIKERLGVPYGKGSCHTAEVGGYFIEGHVPAEDVKRLLAEKPAAKGLTVPGMPLGSPGMEVPDGTRQPYTVELVELDGDATAFASHD